MLLRRLWPQLQADLLQQLGPAVAQAVVVRRAPPARVQEQVLGHRAAHLAAHPAVVSQVDLEAPVARLPWK